MTTSAPQKKSYDIIIKSGNIIDGTGAPWIHGDIGITGSRISTIGSIPSEYGERIIDAKNLYVTPGFIDVHTHVDTDIETHLEVKNYLMQGVTTVVGGNCGSSHYPLQELFKEIESKISINFASFVGHNTIREEVMGNDDRAPDDTELQQMQKLVTQEMETGALGLSTGLSYVPGRYATTEEIVELAKMINPFHGVYATHMRNQGEFIKEAIEEAVNIGKKAGVSVQISHIKLANEKVWGKYHLIFDPIENAREAGVPVFVDQYPYTATSSGFGSSFLGWAVSGGPEKFAERIKDAEMYQKIKEDFIKSRLTSEYVDPLESIYISENENHPEYEGKNIAEILDFLDLEQTISNGADLIIKMYAEDQPGGVFFQMDEKDVCTLMKPEYTMIGSDGSAYLPGEGVPHPRSYGTFVRVLSRYVKKRVVSLPDAVRKMTSLPGLAMGFYQRGLIREGMYADIVIFDGDVEDNATYKEPHQYPDGIHWVIVNGKVVVHSNEIINRNMGRILYNKNKGR
jgi:N-acyl-D-amino-acid deacylase